MQTSRDSRQVGRRYPAAGQARPGGGAESRAGWQSQFRCSSSRSMALVALVGLVSRPWASSPSTARACPTRASWTTSSSSPSRSSTTAPATVELARFNAGERREPVTFEQIPPILIDAITSTEDRSFWTNTGVDPIGIVSATVDSLRGRERGASTITQQLVRQRLLDPELVRDPDRVIERKIKEIIQSVRADRGLPRRGRQAADHGRVPEPELLRQRRCTASRPPRAATSASTTSTT